LYHLAAGIAGDEDKLKTRTAKIISFLVGTLGGLVGFSPASRIGAVLWGFPYTRRGGLMAVSVFILSLGIAHGTATILALKQRPADWHGNFWSQWHQLRQVTDKCSLGFFLAVLGWLTYNRFTGDISTENFVVSGSIFLLVVLFLGGGLNSFLPRRREKLQR
jgi:hypothetical protein